MSKLFNDKVAIITGSSSGIGESIAIAFASRGAKITLCGRDQGRLKSVYDKAVKANGGHAERVHAVHGDLNCPNVRKATISQTIEKFGRLDILVSNAGTIHSHGALKNATEESYDSIMNTNLRSSFFLIQQAIPHLEISKGNIIIISSISSTVAMPFELIYSLSKTALDHLTHCLAVELGPSGVRVNSINPGFIPTRVLRTVDEDVDKFNTAFLKLENPRIVLKGRYGNVENIAEAAVFLASESAGFITGENIKVDGGRSLANTIEWPSEYK